MQNTVNYKYFDWDNRESEDAIKRTHSHALSRLSLGNFVYYGEVEYRVAFKMPINAIYASSLTRDGAWHPQTSIYKKRKSYAVEV
jgi:hypothetical protein